MTFRNKRAATKELARLWCVATTQGEREEFEKSELFNPTASRRWIRQAYMQGPRARSRSPRSACPESFLEPAVAVSESAVAVPGPRQCFSSGQTSLEGFFEPAVAVSMVKGEHTAVAEANVKAEPRASPTCKPAAAVPPTLVDVFSSGEE